MAGGIIVARGYYGMGLILLAAFGVGSNREKWLMPILMMLLGIFLWGQAVTGYEDDYHQDLGEENHNFVARVKSSEGDRFLLDRVRVQTATGWSELGGSYWIWDLPGVNPGDIVAIYGQLQPLSPPANPGQPDWRLNNLAQNIWGYINSSDKNMRVLERGGWGLSALRSYFQGRMEKNLGSDKGGFLAALLLGQRWALTPREREAFYGAGMGHVLAVSGLHIGFVALLLWGITHFIPVDSRIKTVIFCILLLLYLALVGWRASVIRAGVMAMGIKISTELKRGSNLPNNLGLALILLLVINPFHLWTAGFQLSLIITFFLLLGGSIGRGIRGNLLRTVYFSSLATAAAAPLTAFHFQVINPLNILGNIWALPLTGIIVLSGLVGLIPGPGNLIWEVITRPAIMVFQSLLDIWNIIPGAEIAVPRPPLEGIIFYYVLLLGLLFWLEPGRVWLWQKYKNLLALRVLPVIPVVLIILLIIRGGAEEEIKVVFLDVGQGDAAHIQIPGAGDIMIDGGGRRGSAGDDIGYQILWPYLQSRGIGKLEAIFISHFHEDHYRGFIPLLDTMSIGAVYGPPLQEVWQEEEILAKGEKRDLPYLPLQRGAIFDLPGGNSLEIIHPGSRLIIPSALNNNSLTMRLTLGGWTFLFTGDIEGEAEQELINKELLAPTDVLKVAHHGSLTSTAQEFLELVDPRFAVIPVGPNPFGHPAPEVVERLKSQGIRVFKTARDGAVTFTIDQQGRLEVESFKKKQENLFPLPEDIAAIFN